MIEDYKIVCGTWATNVVENCYYPCTLKCFESFSNTEYVDEVLVADGFSSDETQDFHKDVDKINFLESTPWDTDDLSQRQVLNQLEDLIVEISKRNEKTILIISCADIIYTNDFRGDLRMALKQLILDDSSNFVNLPFAKVVTKNIREKKRPVYQYFYTYSAIKFTPKIKWDRIGKRETSLVGDQKAKRMSYDWTHPMLSYETWFFKKEDLLKKAKNHFEWNESWDLKDIIARIYKSKLKRYGRVEMSYEDHPKEGQELIDLLKEDHLGHSLFGEL
jgi:hypothetical protein